LAYQLGSVHPSLARRLRVDFTNASLAIFRSTGVRVQDVGFAIEEILLMVACTEQAEWSGRAVHVPL
jgi:hypothetical protein